jgi:putative transposase
VHGLSQAFMKRGLPRALMTDNGAAMLAEETVSGLARLGVVHQTTLPYSPYQNAKQESFWGRIEGRLMAMLEGEELLTLDRLNQASQAWVEQEYHRTRHSEIDTTPLARYLAGPSVRRDCPDTATTAGRLPDRGGAPPAACRWHGQSGRRPASRSPPLIAISPCFTCATPAGT